MNASKWLWLICLLSFNSAIWAAPLHKAYAPLLKNIAYSPLEELHIIGLDVDGDKNWRWATWSDSSKEGSAVNLMLLMKVKKNVVITWGVNKQDAYEPMIIRIVNWRFGQHPIVAFTYRLGAQAQQIELYGLDEKNRPLLLDTQLGEQIEWRIGTQGQTVLSLYNKPDGHLIPICYSWQKEKRHLELLPCP